VKVLCRVQLLDRSLLIFAALVGILGLIWPSTLYAYDKWSDPYLGVSHLHRVKGRTDVHILLVDLTVADLSVVATHPRDRGLTVRGFAQNYGVDIAINANYFHVDTRSCGLAVGDGEVWRDSFHSGCGMSLGFGPANQALAFNSSNWVTGPLPWPWMTQVITGKPWLIRHGVVQFTRRWPNFLQRRHPRTAIGLTYDRGTLVIVVADGRRKGVPGLTGTELTRLMVEFGAYDAVNLDGGGSSELYVRDEGGVQNHPSDGRARVVSNHLGIRIGSQASAKGTHKPWMATAH